MPLGLVPLDPVWSVLLVLGACFFLGGLPLTDWLVRLTSGKRLTQLGTGNIGVSAAFYHGGTWVGSLAVCLEAAKGIAAVLLAEQFFPEAKYWQLLALVALVVGRALFRQGAGTTNVVWGALIYDWEVTLLVFVLGGIGFTLVRERRLGRMGMLVLPPLVIFCLRQSATQTLVAMVLSGLLALIYQQIPDDLDLQAAQAKPGSQKLFKFFQGGHNILSLDQPLMPKLAGQKAANLAQLKQWGYAVPKGWVLPAGEDAAGLVAQLNPLPKAPMVVRSSAIGEDTLEASAAGQYQSILQVVSRQQLAEAISICREFYEQPRAQQYRQDKGIAEASGLAVLVQEQITGLFSGVAFSRDPVQQDVETVAIEVLPGNAQQVVSGQKRPEAYQVQVPGRDSLLAEGINFASALDMNQFSIQGELGQVPPELLCRVALLARELEAHYHGIPQDVEWSFDGQTLWVLQTRPISTLWPIWTRKIAAEVIPGVIHPLTWSINRPLTCGVWGQLFTLVLGKKAAGLDFQETATLHWGRAYFNASLLGDIFRRMGLPPESLEFLTLGAKMSRPSLRSTLGNLGGLLKLLGREISLERDFRREQHQILRPLLSELAAKPAHELTARALHHRIEEILGALRSATYYNIMAPLSAALRASILGVQVTELDTRQTPEAAALAAIQSLASQSVELLGDLAAYDPDQLYLQLSEHPAGQSILSQLNALIDRYGYLSAVGTDIAVPTWREDPQPVRGLFRQLLFEPKQPSVAVPTAVTGKRQRLRIRLAQNRLTLKGLVAAHYNQLLAELRWAIVALEQQWLNRKLLAQPGDIFFLEYAEIRHLIEGKSDSPPQVLNFANLPDLIQERRQQFQMDQERPSVPGVVYGQPSQITQHFPNHQPAQGRIQGIGASPGQVTGQIKIVHNFADIPMITPETIIVVPYTDAGWVPLLARAGGMIAEVGGRLSHGAIIAREYQIPAVMEISHATQRFHDGQWVRLDGSQGWVEILETPL